MFDYLIIEQRLKSATTVVPDRRFDEFGCSELDWSFQTFLRFR